MFSESTSLIPPVVCEKLGWPSPARAPGLKIQGSSRYFTKLFRLHEFDPIHTKDTKEEVSVE